MTSTEELIERWRTGGTGDGVFPDNDIRKLADALKAAKHGLTTIRWRAVEEVAEAVLREVDYTEKEIERICEGKGETSV